MRLLALYSLNLAHTHTHTHKITRIHTCTHTHTLSLSDQQGEGNVRLCLQTVEVAVDVVVGDLPVQPGQERVEAGEGIEGYPRRATLLILSSEAHKQTSWHW